MLGVGMGMPWNHCSRTGPCFWWGGKVRERLLFGERSEPKSWGLQGRGVTRDGVWTPETAVLRGKAERAGAAWSRGRMMRYAGHRRRVQQIWGVSGGSLPAAFHGNKAQTSPSHLPAPWCSLPRRWAPLV